MADYAGYSPALLALGICLQNLGRRADAEKAYIAAADADPKFALPFIRAAALEAASGNMQAALTESQKAINLNPGALPDAYALNAIAEISLGDSAAAEKSARAGLALDAFHEYPELEYSLGMVLLAKDDSAEGREHLQRYVAQSPNGPNASAARSQLAQMAKPDAPAAKEGLKTAMKTEEAPAAPAGPSEPQPSTAALQNANAPLLKNPDAYTCLESVLPAKFDPSGRPTVLDTIRVDIAVLNGKEIYGAANGKHFANTEQREMLGYNFSTTGLFSSIARAIISGTNSISRLLLTFCLTASAFCDTTSVHFRPHPGGRSRTEKSPVRPRNRDGS